MEVIIMASIKKRGSVWHYRITWTDDQGNKHSASKSGFRTKALAMTAATHAEDEKNEGTPLDKSKTPIADYWHAWFTVYKLGKRAVATEHFYPIIEDTLRDFFGSKPLNKITASQWQLFLNDYGEEHAHSTVSKVNGYVRSMVQTAINDQVLRTDFTFNAEITGYSGKPESDKYLQLDQFTALSKMAHERSDFMRLSAVAIFVAAQTGLRMAEVLGLTWDNIDYRKHTITVDKSWDYIYHTGFKATKTPSSMRTVDVLPAVTETLQKIHKQQLEWLMKSGARNATDSIFYSKWGGVLTGAAVNKVLVKMQTKLKIPAADQITFHGLRHSHVSFLLSQGIEIYYISKRLGHSNIQTTLTTYSHLLKSKRDEQARLAVDTLTNLL
jgi:integrase